MTYMCEIDADGLASLLIIRGGGGQLYLKCLLLRREPCIPLSAYPSRVRLADYRD